MINGTPIPDDAVEGPKYKAVVGEARFMRGLAYFYLVRMFGEVPRVTNSEQAALENNPRVRCTTT